MQKIKVWFKLAITYIKKIPNAVDFLSKVATIGVCVVAIFGYVYTIKPTYDIKILEKEIKNLKEEKSALPSLTDSSQEKIKEGNIIIKTKMKEISNLNVELKNIEKTYYDTLIAQNLLMDMERMGAILSSLNLDGNEKIKHLAKQPNQVIENNLKKFENKEQNSISQTEKQIYAKILNEYKKGVEKNKKYLKCEEPDYISWEKLKNRAKELVNDNDILSKCLNRWENGIMQLNKWNKNQLDKMEKSNKGIQENKIEFMNSCIQNIKINIDIYFAIKMNTYEKACHNIILSINEVIMQQYDSSKIQDFNKQISNPNIDELKQFILERIR